jgi:hypothetical protein
MDKTNKLHLGIFLLIGIVMSISLISAEVQTLDSVQQFDCVTLKQKYANSTYSNITTISYPNDTQIISNYAMSGSNGNWYYQFCDTGQMGAYEYCTRTDVDGVATDACIKFEVTPDGFTGTLGFYFLILGLSAGIIILGFALKDAPITILGSLGLYFIALYILFNGIAGMKDPVYTWALGLIVLGLAFYISTKSAHELIED